MDAAQLAPEVGGDGEFVGDWQGRVFPVDAACAHGDEIRPRRVGVVEQPPVGQDRRCEDAGILGDVPIGGVFGAVRSLPERQMPEELHHGIAAEQRREGAASPGGDRGFVGRDAVFRQYALGVGPPEPAVEESRPIGGSGGKSWDRVGTEHGRREL